MIDLAVLQSLVKRLSKREKLLLYLSIFAVFCAVLVGLVITPSIEKIGNLQEGIEATMLTIEKDLRFLSHKDNIAVLIDRYTPYLSEAESPEEEKNYLIKLIEKFAEESSLVLLSRTASFTVEGNERTYTITVNCEGTMPQIMEFLYRVESSKKLLDVDRFSMTPTAPGSETGQMRLTITRVTVP